MKYFKFFKYISFVSGLSFFYIPLVLAHPHVWVYTDLTVFLNEKGFDTLQVQWNFDEMYSTALLMESDTNHDGYFDKAESNQLFKDVFSDLKMIQPFMYFDLGGQRFSPKKFENFKAWVGEDGSVYYRFLIPLGGDYGGGDYRIGFFDPSQYISFEQGLEIEFISEEKAQIHCVSELYKEKKVTLSYDGAHPEIYKIVCE